MKNMVLTGINGTVAQALKRQLCDRYDVSGISIVRMDELLNEERPTTWKAQLDAYRARVMEQLNGAFEGVHTVGHLGWNTRDEHHGGGLDPLNILVVDCVYQAALAQGVKRIYMASSVHSYDFEPLYKEDVEPCKPFPDTRQDPFGVPPTSLYGVSKRWMEIAGQHYAKKLADDQKILVVRLGGIGDSGRPYRRGSRLWNSHPDLAGLMAAFVESEDAPKFWVAFGVSNNCGDEYPRPLFDAVNPYGFSPADNSFELD